VPFLNTAAVKFLAALLLFGAADAQASNISRDQLQSMFSQIQQNSNWDLTKPLLWGYFFVNPVRGPLDKAAPLLAAMGYRIVDISHVPNNANSRQDKWRLHVERIEIHTVDSLDARNRELNDFARANGIAFYDGMDVGSPSASP
jgi:hypothetical protein